MKRIVSILVCAILLFSICSNALASNNRLSTSYASSDSVKDDLREQGNDTDYAIQRAKKTVEEYLRINMCKYDPAAKGKLSYDHIIRADNSFKDYAEKLLVLTNNRYKSFDSLKLERVNYKIEYGEISCNKGLYTLHVSVLEEKKYENQVECGYVFTNHTFTVKQENGMYYIEDDVTDDYVDTYLREHAYKGKCMIDELIESDKEEIRCSLGKSREEMEAYLLAKELSNCPSLEINRVDSFSEETRTDIELDSTASEKENQNEFSGEEYLWTGNRGVRIYSLDYNKMYDYAKSYNRASPYKIANRNPNYANFDGWGGDCTNYASQIIYAGGAPMDNTGNYQWYYFSSSDRCSWTGVEALYSYLIHNDYIGPQGTDVTSWYTTAVKKGDLVQLRFHVDDQQYDHTLWIISHQTGTTGYTRIACHTSDRWNEPIASMTGYKRWIRLTGYGK